MKTGPTRTLLSVLISCSGLNPTRCLVSGLRKEWLNWSQYVCVSVKTAYFLLTSIFIPALLFLFHFLLLQRPQSSTTNLWYNPLTYLRLTHLKSFLLNRRLKEGKKPSSPYFSVTPDNGAINLENLWISLKLLSPPCALACVCFCLIRIYRDSIIIIA